MELSQSKACVVTLHRHSGDRHGEVFASDVGAGRVFLGRRHRVFHGMPTGTGRQWCGGGDGVNVYWDGVGCVEQVGWSPDITCTEAATPKKGFQRQGFKCVSLFFFRKTHKFFTTDLSISCLSLSVGEIPECDCVPIARLLFDGMEQPVAWVGWQNCR